MGEVAIRMLHRFSFTIDEGRTIFTVAVMILSYAIPQILGGNGYLAVYICGILMGNSRFPKKRELVHFFDAITGISQMMIFFLLGLLVTPVMLPRVFVPALLIMLFMTFFARPLAVVVSLLPFGACWKQIVWEGGIVFAIMAVLGEVSLSYDLFNLVFCIVQKKKKKERRKKKKKRKKGKKKKEERGEKKKERGEKKKKKEKKKERGKKKKKEREREEEKEGEKKGEKKKGGKKKKKKKFFPLLFRELCYRQYQESCICWTRTQMYEEPLMTMQKKAVFIL